MRDVSASIAWLLPFGLLVFAIIFVPLRILEGQGLPRYRALRAELHEVNNENARMRRQLRELSSRVERLRSDPTALERIARDELGMLRRGELVFQFSD
jgi:cell division protein FtsB